MVVSNGYESMDSGTVPLQQRPNPAVNDIRMTVEIITGTSSDHVLLLKPLRMIFALYSCDSVSHLVLYPTRSHIESFPQPCTEVIGM